MKGWGLGGFLVLANYYAFIVFYFCVCPLLKIILASHVFSGINSSFIIKISVKLVHLLTLV